MFDVLQRLGRAGEAIDAMLAFERDHGSNDDLNALISSCLMGEGRTDELLAEPIRGTQERKALSPVPSSNRPESATSSGAPRARLGGPQLPQPVARGPGTGRGCD